MTKEKLLKLYNEVNSVLSEIGENTVFNFYHNPYSDGFEVVFQERPTFTKNQIDKLIKIFGATSGVYSKDNKYGTTGNTDIIFTEVFQFTFNNMPRDNSKDC